MFPAAKKALDNNIIIENLKEILGKYQQIVIDTDKKLKVYNTEGQLHEEFVLDHVKELMNCLRNANVVTRWIMLHRHCKNKKFKEMVET